MAITAFAFSIALWAAFCVTLEAFIAFEKIGRPAGLQRVAPPFDEATLAAHAGV